jgi:spermidine synthase
VPRQAPIDGARLHAFAAGFLALSGVAALIDEHLLSKLLVHVVGSSAEAVAVVLVAFMGGMSLGARLAERRVRRLKRPLETYAAIEMAIGLLALTLPVMLGFVSSAYVSVARVAGTATWLLVVRFGAAVLVASLPGLFMGATMPVLFEALRRIPGMSPLPFERYYSANTFGAALGVLASTYVLVEQFGVRGTLTIAASINLLIAAGATLLQRRLPPTAPDATIDVGDRAAPVLSARLTVGLAFGSGLLAFLLETLWFRVLAVIIGSSVYAFGVMLFAFLVANAWGSGRAARVARARPLTLALTQAGVGLATLASIPWFDDVPRLFRTVSGYVPSFALWEGTRFVGATALLLVPCAFMGASFALLLRLGGGSEEATAERVARIYVFNTAGAMLGTLLGTFVLAPALGSQRALVVVALAEVALAAVVLSAEPAGRPRRLVVAGLVALAVALLVPQRRWDIANLLSGSNVYFREGFLAFDRLRFLQEDRAGGMVAVIEHAGTRTLIGNGKFEGNDGFEVPDQQMFALLPLLFVHQHREAVSIGIGTGNSLATIAAFPFRHIDAVELSRASFEAARQEFATLNRRTLDDAPRVQVHIEDGRNFLLTTPRRYDLIQVQLTAIWIAGAADLYNREYYEIAARRLAPGGVLQQWLQLHHIQAVDTARVIATMRSVFPHVMLFVGGHQGVLVASREPFRADAAALRGWMRNPEIARVVRSSGLEHPYAAFAHLYLDERGVDAYVRDIACRADVDPAELISTDDRPSLEYSTPRGNLLVDAVEDNMERLRHHSTVSLAPLVHNLRDEYDLRLLLAYACRERGYSHLTQMELGASADRARREGHVVLTDFAAQAPGRPWP